MLNRRTLLTTLTGAAGGLVVGTESLLGKATPAPKPVRPSPTDGEDLSGLYPPPKTIEDATKALLGAFARGVEKQNAKPNVKPNDLPDPVKDYLATSYADVLKERFNNHDFDGTDGAPAAVWVLAIDHAFILGQLAVYCSRDSSGKPTPLEPRHVRRAQARFRRATTADSYECYINTEKAYELPKPAKARGGPKPASAIEKCKCKQHGPIGITQIDEECPLCG